MGRELMRVPLYFNAPLNKVWRGYINPHYKKCPDCENGYTRAAERLNDLVSLLMLSGDDSLKGKNHPYFDWITKSVYGFNSVPSPEMAELTAGLAGRKPDGLFGHDASDRWSASSKIIEAAGLPKEWGTCKTCQGDAIHPEAKEDYDAWQQEEPPTGEGYQLWETTSEGSPTTPVFKTLELLCEYAADNCTTFATNKATKEQWMGMLDENFVSHKEGNVVFL
jgi:hypothetical protein